MKESPGPRKTRRCGECHVFARMDCRRCGIAVPHRRLFFPEESLKLKIQESFKTPRVAQCTSDTVLPRSTS